MVKKALKSILIKDVNTRSLIQNLVEEMKVELTIISSDGKLLWGDGISKDFEYEIKIDDEKIAVIHVSKASGALFVELISVMVQKELDKKNIGREVLGLYREINMIYNFSEKISETIEARSIADIALKEASQIINANSGLFLMYDQDSDQLSVTASFGIDLNQQNQVELYFSQLKNLILKGDSSILSPEIVQSHPALRHLFSMIFAPLKVKHRTLGMILLGRSDEIEYTAAELKLLTTIALQSASALESAHLYQKGLQEAKEREDAIRKIHDKSLKFVPFEFIRSLGKNNLTEINLGDQVEREVTVMFVDIRAFTTLSEKLHPRDNFLFINAFNQRMGPVIRKNQGFINQYLGDGFMAIFPEGSQTAIRAAIEMNSVLGEYNDRRIKKGRIPIRIGIGMQNGNLIMGITGDVERMEAATISDTVNTAARIEGLSKHYGCKILLTEDCINNLSASEEFEFRYLGLVKVKGKENLLKIFECINADPQSLYHHKVDTLQQFDQAMQQFHNKEFAMAAVAFQAIVKKNKSDHPANLFLNKSAHMITAELEEDWQGVQTMEVK